ncbi:MAG TPA: response regulator [Brevundimonas sp.]|jgi:CheY-like chemotaxis protein|uniref:response regulator n=1 Tax=Brevundimonas sp. TaxID=1871086 RepID=UPI002DE409D0|nr:response regulator [Brevundimonas sp.]
MTLKVLHVDDEADIREVAAFSLELDPDIELQSAESGAAALDVLGSRAVDVVLLDVMMPAMDGPETLRRLREVPGHETTPVVFMTARAQETEVDKYRALGALDVIIKPFDPMTLAQQLRSVLAASRR